MFEPPGYSPTQSTVNPLGAKGIGESGCTASIRPYSMGLPMCSPSTECFFPVGALSRYRGFRDTCLPQAFGARC